MKTKTIKVDVTIMDDYTNIPASARICIEPELLNRIKVLSCEVKRLKVYEISLFDNTPDWLSSAKGDANVFYDDQVECCILHIGDKRIHWSGYIKHTDVLVETLALELDKL